MIPIPDFLEQLNINYQLVSPGETYLVFCGYGLVARCFYVQDKILVMLAGSEWVIENQQDINRACEDIHTIINNRKPQNANDNERNHNPS